LKETINENILLKSGFFYKLPWGPLSVQYLLLSTWGGGSPCHRPLAAARPSRPRPELISAIPPAPRPELVSAAPSRSPLLHVRPQCRGARLRRHLAVLIRAAPWWFSPWPSLPVPPSGISSVLAHAMEEETGGTKIGGAGEPAERGGRSGARGPR
jgi:hypothetical protein